MPEQVLTAFRLGWTISEVFGYVRKGTLEYVRDPRAHNSYFAHTAPRLSYSSRDLSPAQALWIAALHLVKLSGALGLRDQRFRELDTFLHNLRDYLDNPAPDLRPTVRQVYDFLESWSDWAWSELNSRHEILGRAFTYGGSVADTYWYMRRPDRRDFALRQESWHTLLRKERLREEAERIEEIREYFPDFVAPALKHSLAKWGIAEQLMQLAESIEGSNRPELPEEVEKEVYRSLEKQAKIWHELLFGIRRPQSYLRSSDRWQWRALHLVFFFLVAGGVLILTVHGLKLTSSWLGSTFFPSLWNYVLALQPEGQRPSLQMKDFFSLVPLLLAAVGFLPLFGNWLFRSLRALYVWQGKLILCWFIKRRTVIPWNQSLKAQ